MLLLQEYLPAQSEHGAIAKDGSRDTRTGASVELSWCTSSRSTCGSWRLHLLSWRVIIFLRLNSRVSMRTRTGSMWACRQYGQTVRFSSRRMQVLRCDGYYAVFC